MTGWLLLVVYIVGYLVAWRFAARWVVYENAGSWVPETEDFVYGVVIGAFIALLWPLWFTAIGLWRVCQMIGVDGFSSVLGEPRSVRIERLEHEAKERESRIRDLEREAGVR